MKFVFLFIIFIGIQPIFLLGKFDLAPYNTPTSKDEIIAKKITDDVAKKLLAEHNLHLIGTGAQMMNEIEMLGVSFDYFNELDISTGRRLLVHCLQAYLQEINENKEIRKYLKNYPFTVNNIELRIWIKKPDGSQINKEKPSYLSAINGKLYYNFDDPKSYSRTILHQESFGEALKAMHNPQSYTQHD